MLYENVFFRLESREKEVLTRRDYRREFLRNPSYFLRGGMLARHLYAYIKCPEKIDMKNEIRAFLVFDNIVQAIRKIIGIMFVKNNHIGTCIILGGILLFGFSDFMKLNLIVVIVLFYFLEVIPKLLRLVDHIIPIVNVLLNFITIGNSEFLSKSYLQITRCVSDKLNFLFLDNAIYKNSRGEYELDILELLSKYPVFCDIEFNVLVTSEFSNLFEESRKMLAIYDLPNNKVYEYSQFSIGLYVPASNTIICKFITDNYIDTLLNDDSISDAEKDELIFRVRKYNNNLKYFRCSHLYHEFSHMIINSKYSSFLDFDNLFECYEIEKDIIFGAYEEYFKDSFEEYLAECISIYLMSRVHNISVDEVFRKSKTFSTIDLFFNSISETI